MLNYHCIEHFFYTYTLLIKYVVIVFRFYNFEALNLNEYLIK